MEIKSKIKRMALIMMSLFTIFMAVAGNITVLKASETSMEVNITEWAKVHEYMYLPVKCNVGNTNISYTYDENFDRTSKTVDGIVTTYTYEEYTNDGEYMKRYRLVSENRNGEQIEYMYDDVNMGKVTGFTYDGNTYSYQYNEYGSITGIMYDDMLIGTYNYNDDYVSTINYDLSENNIMSINPLRCEGCYLDDETGYYYSNRKYNDLKNGKILNKYPDNYGNGVCLLTESEEYRFNVDVAHCIQYYAWEMGEKVQYQPNGAWTSGMSEVEILARAIYAEFTSSDDISDYSGDFNAQREAIAWIIQNRVSHKDFPNTPGAVVTQVSAFSSITGDADTTELARNPSVDYDGWQNAVYLAAVLHCGNAIKYGSYTPNQIIATQISKRYGISTQKYFCSLYNWRHYYNSVNSTYTWPDTKNTVKVCNLALNVGNIQTGLSRNIFFDIK